MKYLGNPRWRLTLEMGVHLFKHLKSLFFFGECAVKLLRLNGKKIYILNNSFKSFFFFLFSDDKDNQADIYFM